MFILINSERELDYTIFICDEETNSFKRNRCINIIFFLEVFLIALKIKNTHKLKYFAQET